MTATSSVATDPPSGRTASASAAGSAASSAPAPLNILPSLFARMVSLRSALSVVPALTLVATAGTSEAGEFCLSSWGTALSAVSDIYSLPAPVTNGGFLFLNYTLFLLSFY
jgi:hypothetical protein